MSKIVTRYVAIVHADCSTTALIVEGTWFEAAKAAIEAHDESKRTGGKVRKHDLVYIGPKREGYRTVLMLRRLLERVSPASKPQLVGGGD